MSAFYCTLNTPYRIINRVPCLSTLPLQVSRGSVIIPTFFPNCLWRSSPSLSYVTFCWWFCIRHLHLCGLHYWHCDAVTSLSTNIRLGLIHIHVSILHWWWRTFLHSTNDDSGTAAMITTYFTSDDEYTNSTDKTNVQQIDDECDITVFRFLLLITTSFGFQHY